VACAGRVRSTSASATEGAKDSYLRELIGLPKKASGQPAQVPVDGFEYVLQSGVYVRKAQSQRNIREALRLLNRQLTYNQFTDQTLVVHST